MLTTVGAQSWVERWDRQQEFYVPNREERFTALIDAVEAGVDRPDPLVLDLGSGPGSLAARLLDRLPKATVVAIDTDPLLMGLGRSAYGDHVGLRFVDLDLRTPGWAAALGLDRPADAAVSTTALHWLSEPALRTAYTELASVLRPGGIFLNGDTLYVGDDGLSRIERALSLRVKDRKFAGNPPEDWAAWWDAVSADPALADLVRERSVEHDGNESPLVATHAAALRDAGFGEVGTLWQHGDNRVLGAIRA